jgi:O-antigen ligase
MHFLDYGIVYWFLVLTFLIQSWYVLDNHYTIRFLGISVGAIFFFLFYKKPFQKSSINAIGIALFLYYLIALISLMWAITPSAGFLQLQTILILMVCYFYFINFSKIQIDFVLFKAIPILSIMALIPAVWQYINLLLSSDLTEKKLYLITGFSAHKNLLGSYLFLLTGLNFIAYVKKNDKKFLILGLLLGSFTLLLLSRSSFLAISSGGLVMGYYLLKNRKIGNVFTKKSIGSILIILFISSFVLNKSDFLKNNINRYNPGTYITSFSGSERILVWYKTRELIKEKWVAGYGIGNWKLVLPSRSLSGSYRMLLKNVVFTRVHNDFLEVWAEIGFLGFLAFLFLFLYPIFSLIRNKKKDLVHFVLLWMFLGYGIISFFDFPKERIEHQILFAFLLAIFVKSNTKEALKLNIQRPTIKVINILFLVGLAFNVLCGYCAHRGEYYDRKGIIAFNRQNWPEVKKNMADAYSYFYKISPVGVAIKWREGIAAYNMNDFTEAEKSFESALAVSPYHFSLLNDYASTLVQLEKYREAEDLYNKVLKINPKYEEALFNLSFTLTQLNRYDEALLFLEKTTTNPEKKKLFQKEIRKLYPQIDN